MAFYRVQVPIGKSDTGVVIRREMVFTTRKMYEAWKRNTAKLNNRDKVKPKNARRDMASHRGYFTTQH
jgi:hypothetical protein